MATGTRGHYDPSDPRASPISGWVLSEETQFKKGWQGGPGRPRGAWPRAALARKLAKGWEADTDAANPDERIGLGAIELAKRMADAALIGDGETVRACAEIINQVEGKPTEHTISEQIQPVLLQGEASPIVEPPK